MHETQIHVRWGELDPYNHVNHAVYLTYMETARIAALDSIGWGMGALEAAGTLILVADVKVRFRRPAVAGDTLRVTTEVIEVRGASSRWRQRILRGTEFDSRSGGAGSHHRPSRSSHSDHARAAPSVELAHHQPDRRSTMTTKAETRLRDELIIWMTTVNTKGVPQTSPVWFLYEGDGFLVYSLRSARITNIKANPAVSLNLDGNGEGGDIVIIEGVARIDLDQPPAHEVPAYTKKYAGKFKEYGWDPEQFSSDYPVPILITRTRMRA